MSIADKLVKIESDIKRLRPQINGEEETKIFIVLPFIEALGYNTRDISDVRYEFSPDGNPSGPKKVDIAIFRQGRPVIIIEVKAEGWNLASDEAKQVRNYFEVCDAPFAILTNGCEYRFYSSLESMPEMDSIPFLVFDVRLWDKWQVEILSFLTKCEYQFQRAVSAAIISKFMSEMYTPLSSHDVEGYIRKVRSGQLLLNYEEEFRKLVNADSEQSSKAIELFDKKNERNTILTVEIPVQAKYLGSKYKARFVVKHNYMQRNDKVIRLYVNWNDPLFGQPSEGYYSVSKSAQMVMIFPRFCGHKNCPI